MRTFERRANTKNGIARLCLCGVVIIIETFLILLLLSKLGAYGEWMHGGALVVAFLLVVYLYHKDTATCMKLPWIMMILMFPVLGVTLYYMVGLSGHTRKMRQRYDAVDRMLLPKLRQQGAGERTDGALAHLQDKNSQIGGIATYLRDICGFPVYEGSDIQYFSEAKDGLEAQKQALKNAKRFIFLEYFAIENDQAWKGIVDILVEKVKEGVEVRVFYDDIGSIGFINTSFVKELEALGIQCRVFNPFMPGINFFLNSRDHRKITVIDGKIGFTGGYNLANEYFNMTHPYGYWKDTGVKITGEAVRSLTAMFLENWNAVKGNDKDDASFDAYLFPQEQQMEKKQVQGFLQPYADRPMDNEQVGQEVYISLVNKAHKYCWFVTPYLVLTDEMIHALGLAAKRGVDVRIITPGIPDKKIVYAVTRSFYPCLTKQGVKIYEYTPGFCHAKMCVVDDVVATCGTINLDYRSLYHNFENGCMYAYHKAVLDTKEDFLQMFQESRDVTEKYTTGRGAFLRLSQVLLRLVAPLL